MSPPALLDRLGELVRRLGGAPAPLAFEDGDARLAAAALMVHAMRVDGVETEAERRELDLLLRQRFALEEADSAALVAAADEADREAVDLQAFTAVVRRAWTEADRRRFIGMLWELAMADGAVHAFEDDLVWRVAELLSVPAEASEEIRRAVAVARGVVETGDIRPDTPEGAGG